MSVRAFELYGTVEVKGVGRTVLELHELDRTVARISGNVSRSSLFGPILGADLVSKGISYLTSALVQGGSALIAYNSNLQQTNIAFSTMMGSADRANQHLKDLYDFALKTPFEFPELIAASRRFQGMGFAAERIIPILTDVGNAVAAVGGNSETLNAVVLQMSQIEAKGHTMAQDLNALANNGVPVWQILSEAIGKTTAETIKLSEQGQISSKVFFEAFHRFSAANYGGMMDKQSRTFMGAISNIKQSVMNLGSQVLTPTFNMIGDKLNVMQDDLANNEGKWKSWAETVKQQLGFVGDGLTTVTHSIQGLKMAFDDLSNDPWLNKLNNLINSSPLMQQLTGQTALRNQLGGSGSSSRIYPTAPSFDPFAKPGDLFSRIAPELSQIKPRKRKQETLDLDTKGDPKGNGPKGMDALTAAQRMNDLNLQIVMQGYDAEEKAFERSLKKRLIDFESYSAELSVLESKRHVIALAALMKEGEAANKIKGANERGVALREVDAKTKEEQIRHTQALADAEDREGSTLEIVNKFIKDQNKAISENFAATNRWFASIGDLKDKLAEEGRELDKTTEFTLRFSAAMQTAKDDGEALSKLLVNMPDSFPTFDMAGVDDPQTTARLGSRLDQLLGSGPKDRSEEIKQLRQQLEGLSYDLTNVFDKSIHAAFVDGWKGMFREIGLGFADMLHSMANDLLQSQILGMLEKMAGIGPSKSTGGGGGSLLAKLLGKIGGIILGGVGGGAGKAAGPIAGTGGIGYAKGGYLPPGQWGMAGEEGPEPIYGGKTGMTVIPNKARGGNVTINHNHFNATFPQKGQTFQQQRSQREIAERLFGLLSAA
jgi:tape measure domain-containing protein